MFVFLPTSADMSVNHGAHLEGQPLASSTNQGAKVQAGHPCKCVESIFDSFAFLHKSASPKLWETGQRQCSNPIRMSYITSQWHAPTYIHRSSNLNTSYITPSQPQPLDQQPSVPPLQPPPKLSIDIPCPRHSINSCFQHTLGQCKFLVSVLTRCWSLL